MSDITPPYNVGGTETGVVAIKTELQGQLDYIIELLRAFETAGTLDFENFTVAGSASYSQWTQINLEDCTRIDADQFSFTDPSDTLSDLLPIGIPVKLNGDTTVYAHVKSVSNAAGTSTVTIFEGTIPTNLATVSYSFNTPNGGYTPVIKKAGAPPTWASDYEGFLFLDTSTDMVYFGVGYWQVMGASMVYKDVSNSHQKGGTAITVTQAGGAVATKLDFGSPTRLAGEIISLVVAGTDRGAVTCDDLDVALYPDSNKTAGEEIIKVTGINPTLSPYGLFMNDPKGFRNEDDTDIDCLWLVLTNNKSADSSDFDIEVIVRAGQEG